MWWIAGLSRFPGPESDWPVGEVEADSRSESSFVYHIWKRFFNHTSIAFLSLYTGFIAAKSGFKSYLKLVKKEPTHLSETSLRLTSSTSASARVPSSPIALFWKLPSNRPVKQIRRTNAVIDIYVWMMCWWWTHLMDTRAWFIFNASARKRAPLAPMLLLRRLRKTYRAVWWDTS